MTIILIIVGYLLGCVLLIAFVSSGTHRTPEEEMRDRDNEERYWRERAGR